MSARKLTDSDKREILKLYRQPEETTSTLAVRYSVSNSTISRFLKSNLSEQEYEVLIQQKRANRTQNSLSEPVEQMSEAEDEEQEPLQPVVPELSSSNPSTIRRRKRSSAASESIRSMDETEETAALEVEVPESNLPIVDFPNSAQDVESEALATNYNVETSLLEEMLGEDLSDLEDEDEEDDEDDDIDLEDEDDWEDEASFPAPPIPRNLFSSHRRTNVQVLPLSDASIPRVCYLVVDRAAELIARPLREFSDLGQIPVEEFQQKTLPIFDNHRVARRFSNRTQRVIKVPDGRMLHKTSSQLKAKGITRLLIDGQVYSLSP